MSREIRIESYSFEVTNNSVFFRFKFNAPDVLVAETNILRDRKSFFYRTLIEQGWLSETLGEQFEYSTDFCFLEDGRVLEIHCKKLWNEPSSLAHVK